MFNKKKEVRYGPSLGQTLREKADQMHDSEIPEKVLTLLNSRAAGGLYDALVPVMEEYGFSESAVRTGSWTKIVNRMKGEGLSVTHGAERDLVVLHISWK